MERNCWVESEEGEVLTLSQMLYEIKERKLIEIGLKNWLAIRQWKDIPMTYEADNWEVFFMAYGTVYCTRWNDIISVWKWWGEDDLETYIMICESK